MKKPRGWQRRRKPATMRVRKVVELIMTNYVRKRTRTRRWCCAQTHKLKDKHMNDD